MKKLLMLCSLVFMSFNIMAADIASISFEAASGQHHESDVLLPETSANDKYQVIYQNLNTSTLLVEQENDSEEEALINQWVTYGVFVKAKVLDHDKGLYKFYIEYTGEPSLAVNSEEKKLEIIDSPDDITYEVQLALSSEVPVCSQFSTSSASALSSGSKFCISLR